MKKYMLLFMIFIPGLIVFSCKKGDDDPAVSLVSRKSRVEGKWKMQSGEITIGVKDSTGAYAGQKYVLSENRYTYYQIGKGANFEDKCKLELLTTKNGEIIIKQQMDSISIESKGNWDFLGKGKDRKNKETISIRLNSNSNSSYWYRLFNKGSNSFIYDIKELRSKKMVLENKEEIQSLTSGYGVYITASYTFVQ